MSRWKLSMTYLRYSNMKLAKWNCCTIVKNLLYNERKNLRRPKHCRGVHTQILPPYISIDVGEAFCYHSAWSSYTDVQVKTLHVYPKRKIVYKNRWGFVIKRVWKTLWFQAIKLLVEILVGWSTYEQFLH